MIKEKILITGAEGFLGGHLLKRAKEMGFCAMGSELRDPQAASGKTQLVELDITRAQQVQKVFAKERPTVVIHCAALSSLESCFFDKALARKVNIEGTKNIATASKKINAHLVFISTDLVFDGKKGDYTIEDLPKPICYYGETKYLAEKEVLKTSKDFAIARLSWCYGFSVNNSKNYLDRFTQNLKSGKEQNLFIDEYRSPISVEDAMEKLFSLALSKQSGIYHIAGKEKLSRYDFAIKKAKELNLDTSLIKKALSKDFQHPDSRPLNTTLKGCHIASKGHGNL